MSWTKENNTINQKPFFLRFLARYTSLSFFVWLYPCAICYIQHVSHINAHTRHVYTDALAKMLSSSNRLLHIMKETKQEHLSHHKCRFIRSFSKFTFISFPKLIL